VNNIIGLYGHRRVGKDTFANALLENHSTLESYAFADALKLELSPFVQEQYHLDIFNVSGDDKELIRPLLIAHGMVRRAQDPLYWVKKVDEWVGDSHNRKINHISVIKDCRFPNEYDYMKGKYGKSFILVGLSRAGSLPPTDEEERNEKEMEKRVDISVHLPNVSDFKKLIPIATSILGKIKRQQI